MSIAQARMCGDPHTAERSITLVTHSRNARAEHVSDFETQCDEPDTEGGATLSGKAICGCVRHSAGWLIEASEKVCAPRSRKNHALTIVPSCVPERIVILVVREGLEPSTSAL